MLNRFETGFEAGATLAAVLLIPIYMGFIHVAPAGALAYAGVGGVAMAAGEELQFDSSLDQVTLWDVVLWTMSIASIGGVGYFLALLFI
jgi:hypothetical protein